MESVLVTLDRDGMALVRADGRSELVPTRPRQVYDITGAGDMVLSVVGLCLASGADYDEAAALGNVAGGLEVEKIGVALLSRQEILRDLIDHHRPEAGKRLDRRGSDRRGRAAAARPGRRSSSPTAASTCSTSATSGCSARPPRWATSSSSGSTPTRASASSRGRPARSIGEADRAELLAALECVDAVTVFDDETPLDLIEAIRPDVLVKGGDYRPDRGRRPRGGRGRRRPARPRSPGRRATRARGSSTRPPSGPF